MSTVRRHVRSAVKAFKLAYKMHTRCPTEPQSFVNTVPVNLYNYDSSNLDSKICNPKILKMHSISAIVLIASLALCAADVSHLPLSQGYLPPLSGAGGYSTYSSYPSYPSYAGNSYSSGGYYSGSRLGSGYTSGYRSGLGSSYTAPLVSSGYNNYATVPQYNTYATPSRTYLPAQTGYSGLDTKYAANGGYIY